MAIDLAHTIRACIHGYKRGHKSEARSQRIDREREKERERERERERGREGEGERERGREGEGGSKRERVLIEHEMGNYEPNLYEWTFWCIHNRNFAQFLLTWRC